jgi:hypothetical protein
MSSSLHIFRKLKALGSGDKYRRCLHINGVVFTKCRHIDIIEYVFQADRLQNAGGLICRAAGRRGGQKRAQHPVFEFAPSARHINVFLKWSLFKFKNNSIHKSYVCTLKRHTF